MANFTPFSALLGGAFIGAAAVFLMWTHGRIAGISGILSGTMFSGGTDRYWRLAFLTGVIVVPVVYGLIFGMPAVEMDMGFPTIAIAGLLVGFGTKLGSGCTSGHGVCGLSRLSIRSMVAVALFMLAGMLTVLVVRYLVGG